MTTNFLNNMRLTGSVKLTQRRTLKMIPLIPGKKCIFIMRMTMAMRWIRRIDLCTILPSEKVDFLKEISGY